MSATSAVTPAFWCEDDEQIVTEPIPVYECSRCSTRTDERRCPDCIIFTARNGEGCPNCFGELQEIDVVTDHDGTTIRAEDYDPDAPALAERAKVTSAQRAADRTQALNKETAALLAASTETTWDQVAVGDAIVVLDWQGNIDTLRQPEILEIHRAGPRATAVAPGTTISLVNGYGMKVYNRAPGEPVRRMTAPQEPEVRPGPASERFKITDGSARGINDYGDTRRVVSMVRGDGDDTILGKTPVVQICLGHAGSRNTVIATFWSPADASAFAAAVTTAADTLAVDDTGEDTATIIEIDERYIGGNPTLSCAIETGPNNAVAITTSRNHEGRGGNYITIGSRAVLLAIAEASRRAAAHLINVLDLPQGQ